MTLDFFKPELDDFRTKEEDNYNACSVCEKYPLCRIKTAFNKIVDEEDIHHSEKLFILLSELCSYYKRKKDG